MENDLLGPLDPQFCPEPKKCFYIFGARPGLFVVSCEYLHGISRRTLCTRQWFIRFRHTPGGTVLTARFLSMTPGGTRANTGAIPSSRARRVRGLLRGMKRGPRDMPPDQRNYLKADQARDPSAADAGWHSVEPRD